MPQWPGSPASCVIARTASPTEDLPAVPVALADDEAANAGRGPRREAAAAPRADERQAVHLKRFAVTQRPLGIGQADGPVHALRQQRANIAVFSILDCRGYTPGQEANARIAVFQLLARLEQNRRLIAGNCEWVAGRRLPFPEFSLPTRLILVLHALGNRVGQPRGVRAELADGDLGLLRIALPRSDVLRRGIIELNLPVADRHAERQPAHDRFGQRGGALLGLRGDAIGVPLADDLVMANDNDRPRAPGGQIAYERVELGARHALAFGRRRLPVERLAPSRAAKDEKSQDKRATGIDCHRTISSSSWPKYWSWVGPPGWLAQQRAWSSLVTRRAGRGKQQERGFR